MALPAFSLAGFLLSSCNKNELSQPRTAKKIGIIGAGIAGLHAAKILRESGYEVEILEAGDRIGGRIQSENHIFGICNAELGASAAYGNNNAWYRMISRNAAPGKINSDSEITYFINGNSASGSDLAGDSGIALLKTKLSEMGSYSGSDQSVQAYIEQSGVPERVRFIFSAIAEEGTGTSTERASVLLNSLSSQRKINTDKYLPGTENFNKTLLREYASVLPLVLNNTPVASIDYTGNQVKVTDTLQKQRIYDGIIVTVPLSILKLKASQPRAIHFSPELPASKIQAMESLGMDSSVRVVLKLKKRLWAEGSKSFFTEGSFRQFEILHEDLVSNTYVIAATAHGGTADSNLDMKSDAELLDMIRQEWNAFIGPFSGSNISEIAVKRWSMDPYIQGSFSYQKTGGSSNCREELSKPIGGKVFFAGEACNSEGNCGTVHGAIESAEAAVQNLISLNV